MGQQLCTQRVLLRFRKAKAASEAGRSLQVNLNWPQVKEQGPGTVAGRSGKLLPVPSHQSSRRSGGKCKQVPGLSAPGIHLHGAEAVPQERQALERASQNCTGGSLHAMRCT